MFISSQAITIALFEKPHTFFFFDTNSNASLSQYVQPHTDIFEKKLADGEKVIIFLKRMIYSEIYPSITSHAIV